MIKPVHSFLMRFGIYSGLAPAQFNEQAYTSRSVDIPVNNMTTKISIAQGNGNMSQYTTIYY